MSIPATAQQDDLRSRLPDPSQFFPELAELAGGMFKVTLNGSIPQTTISLVQLRAGQIVGSTYHAIRQTGDLRKAGETEERITAVASWRDGPYFTDAERVALELVEAVLIPNPFGERVPDELYARASAHYDKALWTLTLAIGQICFHPRRPHREADPRRGAALQQVTPVNRRSVARSRTWSRRAGW